MMVPDLVIRNNDPRNAIVFDDEFITIFLLKVGYKAVAPAGNGNDKFMIILI
jgi:hypothetical protein